LRDSFGRMIEYLRISVTDRCNFRCQYCMPAAGLEWLPKADILSYEEITRVVTELAPLGLRRLRITGGEPTLRPQLEILIAMLRAVPELATRYLDKVEKLGEILGHIHDLDVAAATTDRHPRWFGSEADCEAVRGIVAEHRVVLEREAFGLAAGVFAGKGYWWDEGLVDEHCSTRTAGQGNATRTRLWRRACLPTRWCE